MLRRCVRRNRHARANANPPEHIGIGLPEFFDLDSWSVGRSQSLSCCEQGGAFVHQKRSGGHYEIIPIWPKLRGLPMAYGLVKVADCAMSFSFQGQYLSRMQMKELALTKGQIVTLLEIIFEQRHCRQAFAP